VVNSSQRRKTSHYPDQAYQRNFVTHPVRRRAGRMFQAGTTG